MSLPDAKELAVAIAQSSFSEGEKRDFLRYLPYLSTDRLIDFYLKLQECHRVEQDVMQKVEQTDLKYQVEFKKEIEKMD